MKKKQKQTAPLDGNARTDRFTLATIIVIDLMLIAGFTMDYLQGNISLAYTGSFGDLVLVTLLLDIIFYKVKRDKFRYVAVAGYVLVYAYAVFFARNDLTFVIAFPIITVFILYYDYKLIVWISGIFGAIAILDCAYVVLRHKPHSGGVFNLSSVLLEGLCVVTFLVVLGRVTVLSIQNNDQKIGRIRSMSERVNSSIYEINGQLVQLNEASTSMKGAMEEVNTGVMDTAEAVQRQMVQTEEIQNQIEFIQNAAGTIRDSVAQTMASVREGNREVSDLVEQAQTSVTISNDVVENLQKVQAHMDEMDSITQLIDSIAFQTNIMALNANVEAARAGEFGRGFAVVASEISNMSAKTKEATDSIEELIRNVSDSLKELVDSVHEMTRVIKAEEEKTGRTSELFESIETNTNKVSENADELMRNMGTLKQANQSIVESVQTISAASEEVSALTNQVLETELENADVINRVAGQMKDLAESTEA